MRILVTGMSPTECNSKRRLSSWICITPLLAKMLEELGHEVHFGTVDVGKKLPYDLAFVSTFNFGSMVTAGLRWNALWAAIHIPTIRIVSDWQFSAIQRSMNPETFWATRMVGKTGAQHRNRLWSEKDRVDKVIARWAGEPCPTLLPSFTWGRHDYPFSGPMCLVDPSCWVPVLGQPKPKTREWIFASLTRHDSFIRKAQRWAKWPIVEYATQETKVDEPFLVSDVYAEAWGILSHSYDHAGSGWWRARFNYATQVRSILAQWDECPLPAYNIDYAAIQSLSDEALAGIAEAQAQEFNQNVMPKEQVLENLDKFIDSVK